MTKLSKIVLTGAAGNLGHVLRAPLSALCDSLASVDIADLRTETQGNESFHKIDVAEMDLIAPVIEGAEMVVHFSSIADERSFEELLRPNYLSAYNVWEAAHKAGVRRILYASSVHAVGMHDTNAVIDLDAAHRPDTFYGLAKCFTEDLGRLYWEKRGLESVHMRIFSCTEEPQNVRALGTWLSYGDLTRMVHASIKAHTTGFSVVYGVSANTRAPIDNSKASHLGYIPQDNAEEWAESLMASAAPADPQDPAQMKLGGPFATVPLGESGVAQIKKMSG